MQCLFLQEYRDFEKYVFFYLKLTFYIFELFCYTDIKNKI